MAAWRVTTIARSGKPITVNAHAAAVLLNSPWRTHWSSHFLPLSLSTKDEPLDCPALLAPTAPGEVFVAANDAPLMSIAPKEAG